MSAENLRKSRFESLEFSYAIALEKPLSVIDTYPVAEQVL